ncbi:MAG: PAS domain S-box protein [Deltaproteobacteria bacterium]|nr:PAS domain S-box protein [Deltaproteobacteria bacterium]
MTHDQSEENLHHRLGWLMFLRVIIATFLLGIAAFIQIKGTKSLPDESINRVYIIIIVTYFLSFFYLLLSKKIKDLKLNVYIEALCDVSLITVLVFLTGGIRSIYSILYSLVIIYSGLFLGRRGGLVIASASSILYGVLLDLEYYGLISPLYSSTWGFDVSAGYVLSRIFIHIVSFYIIGLLISFVVEQEKRSRALLAEKESEFYQLDLLYRSIIESVNAGIITIDLIGRIKSFNRAAEEITGFSFKDMENTNIDIMFKGFSKILETAEKEKEKGSGIGRHEILVSGKEGQKIALGFSLSSLIDSKETKIGYIVIFQDLTSAKELENEIEKSRNLALIGEMAAGLAHEIRNPLASLSGSVQLLKMNLGLDDTSKKLIEIVLRGRDQLENLVKNFLLLARVSLNNNEEVFNIKNVIDDILESVRHHTDWNENIKVIKERLYDSSIHGNKTEINQMLSNIILNSIQSMPEGGVLTIETRSDSSDDENGYMEIHISDTGCGIDQSRLSKIFSPFYTTRESGTGLGLTIAHRIADSHKGKLDIFSELNKGTRCIIILSRKGKRSST